MITLPVNAVSSVTVSAADTTACACSLLAVCAT
jgi:hypothetical protein